MQWSHETMFAIVFSKAVIGAVRRTAPIKKFVRAVR